MLAYAYSVALYTCNNKLVRLIALQYAARKCKQNKRYRTSARLDENT